MESDQQEIMYVVEFFVGELQNGKYKEIETQVLKTIVDLYFGRCYSSLKNSADRQDFVALVSKFCEKWAEKVQEVAAGGSDFVRKNVANFYAK